MTDIGLLEVGMADAKMTEGGVLGDEWQHNEEIALQVFSVVRRWLLLVPVTFPLDAPERQ